MESAEQSMEQEEQRICVTTHRKCPVMLCGCVRAGVFQVEVEVEGEDGTEACPSSQRINPITPGERGPLTWRPGRGFSLTHVLD